MTIRQTVTKQNDALTFGKYKGFKVSYVLDVEPSYILWLDSNEIVKFPDDIIETANENDFEEEDDYRGSWGWDD